MNTDAIKQAISIARVYEADMDLDGAAQMARDELAAIKKEYDELLYALEGAADLIGMHYASQKAQL